MLSCDREELFATFKGKRVAIVGSGPGVLENDPGFVDGHDVVVRVNNYATSEAAGFRCDVFYSFFGGSIKKTVQELVEDGVRLCMCKCPDAKVLDSEWHRKNHKPHGTDFRYIYKDRAEWWFCPTYVPGTGEFLAVFETLQQHIPTTGFSAVLAILEHEPASIYLTGFDFFSSKIHNVSEPWRPGSPDDPIGHAPELERAWLARIQNETITFDPKLKNIMETERAVLDT